jgi:hypothetical protein
MMKTACNEVDKQGATLNLYNLKCGLYAPTAVNNPLTYNHKIKLSDDEMNTSFARMPYCVNKSFTGHIQFAHKQKQEVNG